MLKYYGDMDADIEEYGKPEIQVCIDEVNRGGLFGDVFVCASIWDPLHEEDNFTQMIKDSKKLSKKKRHLLREYIEKNVVDFEIISLDNDVVDDINILQSTFKAMHKCLDSICERNKIDRILVDGNMFPTYKCYPHKCIVKGDNQYIGIACSSILAKCNHDDWIENICNTHPMLDERYGMLSNRGYGTKRHMNGLKMYGLTSRHRKTFCKNVKIKDEYKDVIYDVY